MSDQPLAGMLKQVEALSEDRDEVTLGEALDTVGEHSFAPILLLIGLLMLVPGPADIPGVPVLLGVLVIIVSVQILIGREHLWVPAWMERRRMNSERLHRLLGWLKRPAGWLDQVTKQRYTWLIDHAGVGIVSIACILIALATPLLEFIPFSANVAGAAIATFSLALIARDGLIAVIAIVLAVSTVGLVVYKVLT